MDRIFRLLLVDDEPHVTGALSLQLEAREDLDVYIANSAAETLNVLRKTRIDLMVSDIRMPGMTGLELLSRVQKEQPDCKVILLTGYADFNYVYEAMRQGAAGYVLKNGEIVMSDTGANLLNNDAIRAAYLGENVYKENK